MPAKHRWVLRFWGLASCSPRLQPLRVAARTARNLCTCNRPRGGSLHVDSIPSQSIRSMSRMSRFRPQGFPLWPRFERSAFNDRILCARRAQRQPFPKLSGGPGSLRHLYSASGCPALRVAVAESMLVTREIESPARTRFEVLGAGSVKVADSVDGRDNPERIPSVYVGGVAAFSS